MQRVRQIFSSRLDEFMRYPRLAIENITSREIEWHSSAHLLGAALEEHFGRGCFLIDGPATNEGFYYDAFILKDPSKWMNNSKSLDSLYEINTEIEKLLKGEYGESAFLKDSEFTQLEKLMKKKRDWEKIQVTKSQAIEMFRYSPFKLWNIHHINSEKFSVYRCGEFVDLCRGPHSAKPKFIKILKTGAAHWDNSLPQNILRVYGISFDSQNNLKEYLEFQKAAAARNHREIGKKQALFMFDESSPGSPFFLPHGTRIINTLMAYLRKEYRDYGFSEVITPQIFDKKLWVTSGHWQNYKENMFSFSEKGIKPMNCPGHCILFGSGKSWRDLPVRYADFSPLHRNEASGALTGLTRVIKFHQDDGHIFCSKSQILTEIKMTLEMIDRVYTNLGFKYDLALSTRPEKMIGKTEDWDHAEAALEQALTESKRPWTLKKGDGAFYGPKIDVHLEDALGRSHQTATIQLDFQLPERFDLKYQGEKELERPVIIHRAVFGSIERILGILIEHFAGKWPFWLSPRQIMLIPLNDSHMEYTSLVKEKLREYHVDIDATDKTLSKKVREAQKLHYNFIIIIGDQELKNGNLSVRNQNNETSQMDIDEFISLAQNLCANFK